MLLLTAYLGCSEVNVLVIGSPDSTGDVADIWWQQSGPIPLASNWTNQNKPILVANQCHSAVMGPWKANNWGASVIDELDGPPSLILDPHKDNPWGVAGSQFLVGFIPSDKSDLQNKRSDLDKTWLELVDFLWASLMNIKWESGTTTVIFSNNVLFICNVLQKIVGM